MCSIAARVRSEFIRPKNIPSHYMLSIEAVEHTHTGSLLAHTHTHTGSLLTDISTCRGSLIQKKGQLPACSL